MHNKHNNIEMNQRNWAWSPGSLSRVAKLRNSKEQCSSSTEENLLINWITVDSSRIILYIDSTFSFFFNVLVKFTAAKLKWAVNNTQQLLLLYCVISGYLQGVES